MMMAFAILNVNCCFTARLLSRHIASEHYKTQLAKVTVAILTSPVCDCGRPCSAEKIGKEYMKANQGSRHGFIIASILLFTACALGQETDKKSPPAAPSDEEATAGLQKATQNPVSNLIS